MDYAQAQKLVTRYRSRLTRLQNQKDHAGIIRLWDEMQRDFEQHGFPLPDQWSRWQRAADDARFTLLRQRSFSPGVAF